MADHPAENDDEPATVAESPHDQPTRQSGSSSSAGLAESPGGAPSSLHSATAQLALEAEQLLGASAFGRVIALMCLLSLLSVASLTTVTTATPAWLSIFMATTFASTGLCGVLVWRRVRQSSKPQRMMRTFGALCMITSLSVQYYAGVFSPAPAVIALGISYFGLADDRSFGYAMCVGSSIGYVLLAGLVSLDLIPDVGLFSSAGAPALLRALAVGIAVAVFTVMLWQARVSRTATLEAVARLDDALRLVQQREALIEEANQNLDVALAAGGRRGAYSGGVAGAYRLGELLGRGGMGEVYAAAHLTSGRAAAVKLLHGKSLANPDIVQRFLREAEVAMRLAAPNLVEIFELGEAESGTPFLAMEVLTGHDLGWHLRRRRQLPLPEVVALTHDVARGLTVAHAAGVTHRDLKPANLFRVEPDGAAPARWKILDFGIAKLRGSTGTLTQHAIVGTPGYMSPEQAQGHDVDQRSDLFSLGAVLYRALTGRPPFSGPDTPQVLFDIVYRHPARPTELVPSLPPAIDAVLALALAKDRGDRFASAAELAEALAAAADGRLSAALKKRAAAQLRRLPWGATVRPAG